MLWHQVGGGRLHAFSVPPDHSGQNKFLPDHLTPEL
ncbi:hypothetical protein ACLB1S_12825 [Escherichia coli]